MIEDLIAPLAPDQDTTVQDELALVIGVCLNADMSPNAIARALIRSGWQPPDLPYLADMEATRE